MKQYIVDAFTDRVFHGNQAAVCVLDSWLPESLMIMIIGWRNQSTLRLISLPNDRFGSE